MAIGKGREVGKETSIKRKEHRRNELGEIAKPEFHKNPIKGNLLRWLRGGRARHWGNTWFKSHS